MSFSSVCNHTRDKQFKLLLRGRLRGLSTQISVFKSKGQGLSITCFIWFSW